MCVVAACGGSFLSAPGISKEQRWKIVEGYFQQAMQLFRDGFDGPGAPTMTILEAVQVLTFLMRYHIGYGLTTELPAVRTRARDLLDRIFRPVTGPDGIPFGGVFAPRDVVEWLSSEMAIRCAIDVGHTDANTVAVSTTPAEREPFSYFSGRVLMPCHDIFFDMPSAEHAFALFAASQGERVVADPSPFLAADPDFDSCTRLVHKLVGAVFSLRASRYVFIYLFDLFTGLQARARDRAARDGVDLLALAAQDPALDSPSDADHRWRTELPGRLVAELHRAMPEPIGSALAAGDPEPLFARADEYLGSTAAAESVVSLLLAFQSLPVSAWVAGNPATATGAFFSSRPLAAALEAGIVATRLMEALLAREPMLRHCHLTSYMGALRSVTLQAAVARAGGASMVLRDIRTGLKYMAAFAEVLPAAVTFMDSIVALLADSGVQLAVDLTPSPQPAASPSDTDVDDLTRAFAETMMVSDRLLAKILTRKNSEEDGRADGGEGA
ncbi:hypothetical protein DFJ74DRAFT_695596 [Hyaloraphidium curvatum]|nr:hypothetical protein DFJ74DRAFT_695596 [Hyaloraphidium curvatum]